MSNQPKTVPADVAAWMAQIAEAIEPHASLVVNYGSWHISRVVITFDTDESHVSLIPSESDDKAFDIELK